MYTLYLLVALFSLMSHCNRNPLLPLAQINIKIRILFLNSKDVGLKYRIMDLLLTFSIITIRKIVVTSVNYAGVVVSDIT